MITFEAKGDFNNTEKFLKRLQKLQMYRSIFDKYGKAGVAALEAATPAESGLTAQSWTYDVVQSKDSFTITWSNTNIVDGLPIAILIQYGHGTGTGGYVQGRDYINPALRPIFDKLSAEIWKAVTSS